MENEQLTQLQTELKQATEGVKSLVEKQSEEIRRNGETSEQTAKALKDAEQRLEDQKSEFDERLSELEVKLQRPGFGQAPEKIKATPGMQFVMSDAYQSAKGGRKSATDPVDVGNLFSLKDIDPTVGDTGDRAPVWSEQVPGLYFDPAQRQMTLRTIMNVGPTSSNNIEFFQETTFDTDGAASQDGEGAKKNKLEMQFEKKSAPVETIAAWVPCSRQVLDDQAMLQSHIDTRLLYAVEKELERQILFGDGSDGELTGVFNTSGIQDQGSPSGDETALDHVRRAIAKARAAEYEATAIVMHPNDWAEIELQKGSDDHYIWVTVPAGGESRLWRVPVVETTVMNEGQFLTGAFGLAARLWDRMASSIRISENVDDYFVRNLVAVLAELRMAMTVYRPQAFVKASFGDLLSP